MGYLLVAIILVTVIILGFVLSIINPNAYTVLFLITVALITIYFTIKALLEKFYPKSKILTYYEKIGSFFEKLFG